MLRVFQKLKLKWNIQSNFQLFVILLVFAITGSSSLLVADPILAYFNITDETLNPWIYKPLRVILIFPVYQVLILIFGTLFGQFQFFWNFEKKLLARMGFKFFKD